jgi:hypothetical protein
VAAQKCLKRLREMAAYHDQMAEAERRTGYALRQEDKAPVDHQL